MIIGRPVERIIDKVGELLAMATMLLIIVLFINSYWNFITGDLLITLTDARKYMLVAVLGFKAAEFALKRNIIFAIPCLIIIICAVVFVLLPGGLTI